MRLLSATRTLLHAPDLEAALISENDSLYGQYRNAQTTVLDSLRKTAEQLILGVGQENAKADAQRAEHFNKLESALRQQLDDERKHLQGEHAMAMVAVEERAKAQSAKEAEYETKEARYVARQKQQVQITQIEKWLNDWSLTRGTRSKRWPVAAGYLVAISATGLLTYVATQHNYDLLRSADDLAKLQWWHWVALSAKSIFPLAAFTTFMVYFIRWLSAWAKLHSEEEFRNRTLLVDIGRSGWLLEAVRDAQDNNAPLPGELLRELSKNLFADSHSGDSDIHPQAVSELLLQGLSSLRVKTPDGSEIEASRSKGK